MTNQDILDRLAAVVESRKPANGGDGRLVGDPNDGNLAKWPAIFAACEDKAVGGTEVYILEYDGGAMDQVERTAARLKQWGKL